MSSGRARVLDVVGLLARLLLGAVLLVAGGLKLPDLDGSARAVRAYQIFPYDVANIIGWALPIVEVVLGLLLVVGLFTRVSAVLGGLVMLAFIAGIASAWARGLSIDCGCFGGGGTIEPSQTRYGQEIARDVALVLCAAWLAVRPRSALSLDTRLYGT